MQPNVHADLDRTGGIVGPRLMPIKHRAHPVEADRRIPPPEVRRDFDLSTAYLDPEVPLDDHRSALAVVQSWFRAAGLDDQEAKLLVDRFNAAIDPYTKPLENRERIGAEALDYLRSRWGGDFQRNMALVDIAIERLGGGELAKFLNESGLRFDPFVLRTLADAASRHGWQ